MKFETIKVHIKNNVGTITFDRPDFYNAMNRQMKFDICQAINQLNENKEIRLIVLTAKGKAFCTGQDLKEKGVTENLETILREEWNPLINTIRNSQKLVVCALNGVAAGAGASVVFACDIIVSAPHVKISSSFCQIGLVPDAGGTFHWVKALGYHQSMKFALSKKPLTSEQLYEKGIIFDIIDPLDEKLEEWTNDFVKLPPLSLENLKKNFLFAQVANFEEVLQLEVKVQSALSKTEDFKEGVKAFKEKRPPQFQGK